MVKILMILIMTQVALLLEEIHLLKKMLMSIHKKMMRKMKKNDFCLLIKFLRKIYDFFICKNI